MEEVEDFLEEEDSKEMIEDLAEEKILETDIKEMREVDIIIKVLRVIKIIIIKTEALEVMITKDLEKIDLKETETKVEIILEVMKKVVIIIEVLGVKTTEAHIIVETVEKIDLVMTEKKTDITVKIKMKEKAETADLKNTVDLKGIIFIKTKDLRDTMTIDIKMDIPEKFKGKLSGAFFKTKEGIYVFLGYGARNPEEGRKYCEEQYKYRFIKHIEGINSSFFEIANLFARDRLRREDENEESIKIRDITNYM